MLKHQNASLVHTILAFGVSVKIRSNKPSKQYMHDTVLESGKWDERKLDQSKGAGGGGT